MTPLFDFSLLPSWYWFSLATLLGLTWGSFIGLVVWRLPQGLSLLHPNSFCPACKQPLAWFDKVPLLSFLALRGRCRYCQAAISPRYALIELSVTALSLFSMWQLGPSPEYLTALTLIIFALPAALIDLQTWRIPNRLTLPGIAAGLTLAALFYREHFTQYLLGALLGWGVFYIISQILWHALGREGLGLGDAKLLGMIGALLGVSALPWVVLLACVQGLLWAALRFIIGHPKTSAPAPTPHNALPFGPFLALAAFEWLFVSLRWSLGA